MECRAQTQKIGNPSDLLVNLRGREFLHPEGKGDIIKHAHMGIEGIALKHHGYVPVFWRKRVNGLAVKQNIP